MINNSIRTYRKAAGLRQDELARKIGIVPSRMSDLEIGRTLPSFTLVRQICHVLDCLPRELYPRHVLDFIATHNKRG